MSEPPNLITIVTAFMMSHSINYYNYFAPQKIISDRVKIFLYRSKVSKLCYLHCLKMKKKLQKYTCFSVNLLI